MKLIALIAVSTALGASMASAAPSGSVTSTLVKDLKFTPKDQSKLLEFKVTVENYQVGFSEGGAAFGTKMIAGYKTRNIDELEDFAVVQYIKGCKYELAGRGESLEVNRSISREFFDDIVMFQHKDWVIDSVDLDPIYNSTNDMRHAYYRWNSVMDSENKDTEEFFFRQPPQNNRLYVRDMPGTSNVTQYPEYDAFFATNTSLKFKTCIFRTDDVPARVASPDVDLTDKALKCFEWDSSFIYNPESKEFESPAEIDPACK